MKIDNSKVNFLHDALDQAAMLYYEAKQVKYLKCLEKVIHSFLNDEELNLEKEQNDRIKELFASIDRQVYNTEEIRQALMLGIIKGFKHENLKLDEITPDRIGVICSYFIEALFEKESKITALDLNLGTGNLLYTIHNYLNKDLNLLGIENNETLVGVARMLSEMMMIDISIYYQDALKDVFPSANLIIADVDGYQYDTLDYRTPLANQGITYFPYLLLEKHAGSGYDDAYFIYIIPNDFFTQPGNEAMKKIVDEKLQMLALVVLPEAMFVDSSKAKSILIMKKSKSLKKTMLSVFQLPSISDQEKFIETMENIKRELKLRKSYVTFH
jgi:site-specific DNA-methyltransferase (adenine-specific)